MPFEFDPKKNEINQAKYQLSLDLAAPIFEGTFIEEEVARPGFSEPRFVAISPVSSLGNFLYATVLIWRNGRRRIISFRKANDREMRRCPRDHA